MVSLIPKSLIAKLVDGSSSSLVSSAKTSPQVLNTQFYQLNDGQLEPGARIVIEGHMRPAAQHFEVNLWSGRLVTKELVKSGDIAIHFCVNPSGGYSLVNSRLNRQWGREDRTPRGRLPRPLLQNQKFQLVFALDIGCWHVMVNNSSSVGNNTTGGGGADRILLSFPHKMPFNTVGLVSCYGDATVEHLEVQQPVTHTASVAIDSQQQQHYQPMPALVPLPSGSGSGGLPPAYPSIADDFVLNGSSDHVLYNIQYPSLPLLQPIKCGLQPGMIVAITGRPLDCGGGGQNRFDFGLFQGPNPYEDPHRDVVFHSEVYMKEQSIVRNSYQQNEWRTQERYLDHFPFQLNTVFRLTVRVEANRLMVAVNNRHVYDYYHRVLPLSTVDHICIHGSVEVQSLCVMNPPL
ncbi:galectin-9-like [Oppia nitens]|uniref:galectin-9-like n=1 Tax=Oppia nitens TaxID=1686743 RepID=UPI0023DA3871|nr:galectin-9-like [Oppia nitens]